MASNPRVLELLEEMFRAKPLAHWTEWLSSLDVCFGPVQNFPEMLADPQLQARGMVVTDDGGRKHLASAIRFRGKPAVLAVMRDISDRIVAEEALRKQQRLLQSILDNMGDAVIVAAKSAYDLYLRFGVYACQPRRTFRTAQWMGFYLDKTIQPEIPRILHIEPYIEYTDEWIQRLTLRGGPYDPQLAAAVRELRERGATPADIRRLVGLAW